MLQVDQRHEAILVPIYGVLTPFHILTLKNATVNQAHSTPSRGMWLYFTHV